MTGKKHSFLKTAMIIVIIATLNLVGISYGFWSDRLTSEVTTKTGSVRLSVSDPELVEVSDGFTEIEAELNDDDEENAIEVKGFLERNSEGNVVGDIWFSYNVENMGSLPITFNEIEYDSELPEEIFSFDIGTEKTLILPDSSSTDTIGIHIDTTEIDPEEIEKAIKEIEEEIEKEVRKEIKKEVKGSRADDNESEDSEPDESQTYKFNLVITYGIASWTDEINIEVSIKVAKPAASAIPGARLKAVPIELPGNPLPDTTPQEDGQGDAAPPDGTPAGDETTGGNDTQAPAGDEKTGEDGDPAAVDDEAKGGDDEPASGGGETKGGDDEPADSGDEAGGSDTPADEPQPES